MAAIEVSSSHARSVKYHLKHTFVIDNFSYLVIGNVDSTGLEYTSILSAPFKCSKDERIQFQIVIYPGSNGEESKDYVSLFLKMKLKEAAKVVLNYKLSILNTNRKKECSNESTHVASKTATWGWAKFVERTVLLDKANGFLPADKLTILCEVDLYSEPTINSTGDIYLENLESLSIAKNNEMDGRLLESGTHSDVILVLDGGKELKAHKAILSSRSPVFMAMFKADMKEKSEGRVVIEDLKFDVARDLLKFIYTGKVDILASTAEELLSAADKYGLDLLKQICGQHLCAEVTTDNVARLLALADAHLVDKLKRTCLEYIRGHVIEVMLTDDWPLVDKLFIEELRKEELHQKEAGEKEEK